MSSERRTECSCHHLSETQCEQGWGSVPTRVHLQGTKPPHAASLVKGAPANRRQLLGTDSFLPPQAAGMGAKSSPPKAHPAVGRRYLQPAWSIMEMEGKTFPNSSSHSQVGKLSWAPGSQRPKAVQTNIYRKTCSTEASPSHDLKSGHVRGDQTSRPALVCKLEEGGGRRREKGNGGKVSLRGSTEQNLVPEILLKINTACPTGMTPVSLWAAHALAVMARMERHSWETTAAALPMAETTVSWCSLQSHPLHPTSILSGVLQLSHPVSPRMALWQVFRI